MRITTILVCVAVMLAGCKAETEPKTSVETPSTATVTTPNVGEVDTVNVSVAQIEEANELLAQAGYKPQVAPTFQIDLANINVPETLPYKQQVEQHAVALETLAKALADAKQRKEAAKSQKENPKMFEQYLAADEDEQNVMKLLAPYSIAEGQAQSLKDQGYKLTDTSASAVWTGSVRNGAATAQVDPRVALIMIIIGAVVDEINKENPFGENNALVIAISEAAKLVSKPLGGEGSDLTKLRNSLLAHDKNGEIAKLILDPVKRPVEILQDVRDKIIPKNDNGEVAKIAKEPIKCTFGRLIKKC